MRDRLTDEQPNIRVATFMAHHQGMSIVALANVLLGSLAAMATQVANYWLGSSSTSAAKSQQIAALTADAQASVPGDIVQRLLPHAQASAAAR